MAKILIVADNTVSQQLINLKLSKLDLDVSFASDGMNALELLTENYDFDMALIDVSEPHQESLALIESIRRIEEISSLFIIAISNQTSARDLSLAYQAGANEYLSKPHFLQEKLFTAIQRGREYIMGTQAKMA